jgi:ribosomal protein S18 acetylase RimI-like enzyme
MITPLDHARLDEACEFVRNVFNEFVAPFNSDEGNLQFNTYTNAEEMRKRIDEGRSHIWTWIESDKIVGLIAGRAERITLLFVDGIYQRRGIAQQLFDTLVAHFDSTEITVNSSIYAIEAYRRLGFIEIDIEQMKDGLRYVPMVWTRKETKICDT